MTWKYHIYFFFMQSKCDGHLKCSDSQPIIRYAGLQRMMLPLPWRWIINNNKIPEQKKKIQIYNLKVKSWVFKYLNCAHYNLPLNNQNYLQYSNFFGIFEISVGEYFTESTFSVWTESPIAPNRIPIHLNRFPNVIIPLSPSRQRFGIESSFFYAFRRESLHV